MLSRIRSLKAGAQTQPVSARLGKGHHNRGLEPGDGQGVERLSPMKTEGR